MGTEGACWPLGGRGVQRRPTPARRVGAGGGGALSRLMASLRGGR
ncbi:hypothetical protein HMPREF1980_01917 [Actinomyces sp. oral taxon 172 str. F0311]|nr:hypothetical protein HMPREF1980_01917 [Actinomyces sp. oral taxon 172 str. F0311]